MMLKVVTKEDVSRIIVRDLKDNDPFGAIANAIQSGELRKAEWTEPAMPRSVVLIIPIDIVSRVLLLHRSNKVRSARNVWGFPTGLHDIGETLEQAARRELKEEFKLEIRDGSGSVCELGVIENIAGDADAIDQYHWVMHVVAGLVDDVDAAVNTEPDKHDQTEVVRLEDMLSIDQFLSTHAIHQPIATWLKKNRARIARELGIFLADYRQLKMESIQ